MTFSRRTTLAKFRMRSAATSGCSTVFTVESMTSGTITLPAGSFTLRQIFHSCSCRALAAGNDTAIELDGSTVLGKGRLEELAVTVRNREEVNPFLTLHREMNRLFDDVFRGFDLAPFRTRIGVLANAHFPVHLAAGWTFD